MMYCSSAIHGVHTTAKGGVPYVLLLLLSPMAVWLGLEWPILALPLWPHMLITTNDNAQNYFP